MRKKVDLNKATWFSIVINSIQILLAGAIGLLVTLRGDQVLNGVVEQVVVGVMAAIGTAGVPGAGLIMTTLVFTQVGIPLEAVALIAGIDRILDMIRTSINVVGDAASALVVSRLEGEFGTDSLTDEEKL